MGRASVPSGASTGKFEAAELRDGGPRYHGKGVKKAAAYVNSVLADTVCGQDVFYQWEIDRRLREADGTANKERLGANAVLSVSLAAARACAAQQRIPLYRYLGGLNGRKMPVPMMNVLNGGAHADNTVDLQEFMIMPVGMESFAEGLRMCSEVYHTLKTLLKTRGYSTAVGDEGGFAPDFKNAEEALTCLMDAVSASGYEPGKDFCFAIDAAASELYDSRTGRYVFSGESRMSQRSVSRSSEEMVEYLRRLTEAFPICSIEDGLGGGLGRVEAVNRGSGKTDSAGRRRPFCYKYSSPGKRNPGRGGQCHSDQNEPDRNPDGNIGVHGNGKACRIPDDCFSSFRGDRGYVFSRSGSGSRKRSDQNRSSLPVRTSCKI